MTNSRRTIDDLLAISQPCAMCRAKPGEWCVVASGKTAGRSTQFLHRARAWAVQESHSSGYLAAHVDILETLLWDLDHYATSSRGPDLRADDDAAVVRAWIEAVLRPYREWKAKQADRILAEIPQEWRRG